jgi:hypothetical protein
MSAGPLVRFQYAYADGALRRRTLLLRQVFAQLRNEALVARTNSMRRRVDAGSVYEDALHNTETSTPPLAHMHPAQWQPDGNAHYRAMANLRTTPASHRQPDAPNTIESVHDHAGQT